MNLRQLVFSIAWPTVLRTFLNMVVQLADIMMIGRLGAAALAAVGIGNQLFFFSIAAVEAFSVGTTTLVAQSVGANNFKQARLAAWQSVIGSGIVTLGLSVIGVLYSREILSLIVFTMEEIDPEVLNLGSEYLRIVSYSTFFRFTLVVINGVFQGAGNARTPLYLMIVANVINLIGNYLLIFGIGFFPALGVRGGAISTSFSGIVGGLLAFSLLFSRYCPIKLSWRDKFLYNFNVIKKVLYIGLPAALEQATVHIGQIIYTMIVASLGTIAIASHQVLHSTFIMTYLPGIGFSLAATTLVGQFLGAEKRQLAVDSGMETVRYAFFIMAAIGLLFILFPEGILGMFTNESDVINMARSSIIVLALTQPALAVVVSLTGGLRGAGDTIWIMLITGFNMLVIRLGITLILIYLGIGLLGVWIAMAIEAFIRAVLIYRRFHTSLWVVKPLLIKRGRILNKFGGD